MDPLTICATVAGLVKTCGTAVTTCSGLLGKYKNAPEILASIRTECTTIKTTLSYVDWLVKRDTELLSSQLKAHSPLAETFDVALTGCAFTFSLLDVELQKLYDRGKDHDGYKWKDKMRYVWDEDHVKNILDHMRGLQSAVNLVLAALQTSSISALVPLLQDQKPVIERVRQDTRSIRESRSLQLDLTADADRQVSSENYSIFNSSIGDEDFSFDDEIINSFAYRNAIKRLASKAKATQQNVKPDERCILDEPLIDLEELSQTHNGPRIKSTAISNHHSLTPTKTFTHTALSDTVVEDLKSLLPTSIGSPSQQINEKRAGFTSPSYVSGSPNDASANQRDRNRDVEKMLGQRVRDDVYRETRKFRKLPKQPVQASAEPFRRSSQSTSITADAVEDFDEHKKGREGALTHASHHSPTSLLIEYFERGRKPNVHSRAFARVKRMPSAAHKTKDTNDRKPSYTRQISLGPHSTGERQVTDSANDKSISSYTSAAEDSSLAHRHQPVEVEIMHGDQHSDLSGPNIAREKRCTHVKISNTSSMPPDSMLEGEAKSVTPRWVSRSTSRDTVVATDTLKTPSRRRSRSLSKERLAHKVMEKLAGKPRNISSGKHKRSSKTRSRSVSNEQLAEDVKRRRRRPNKGQKEEEVASGAESSLLTTSPLSPRQKSDDQHTFLSGTSKSEINDNPRLLETVENAIRRLIIPELEMLKQEEKMQKSRQNFDRDSRGSVDSGRSGSHTDVARKLSKHTSALEFSGKPKVFLNRDEQNAGTLLSGDSIKGRKKSRQDRSSDSPSRRRSERNMSEKTVIATERNSPRKRSKEQRPSNAAAGATAGGILTAAALKHHDLKHNDLRSSIDREKRRRRRRRSEESCSRSADIAESTEAIFNKHDVPPMPMRSDIHSSDITRDSILSEQTDVTLSPSEEQIHT